MSTSSRKRKERINNTKAFKENSTKFDDTYIFQVHLIPTNISYESSFDFWIIDKKDCWLLCVEKSKIKELVFQKLSTKDRLFCKVSFDFENIDIKEILNTIKRYGGIPYNLT
jgi:hypothetical protein